MPPPEHPVRWLAERAERAADAPAISDDIDSLSYGELWDGLGRWSKKLRAAGMDPGRPTAVVTRARSRLARAFWVGVYDGLPMLPMNPSHTAPGGLMRRCGVTQAIADGDVSLPDGVRRLPARPLDEHGRGKRIDPSPLGMDRAQLLVPTSGTEGPPRAVMLSCRNLASAALATARILRLTGHHRWLCCLPLTHIAGLMILARCAAAGASVLVQEGFNATRAARAISDREVTHVSLVPAMLYRLVEAGADPSGLESVLVGGAPISEHLTRRALDERWPLNIAYGLTETTAHVATGELLRSDRSMAPLPGVRIHIVDTQERPIDDVGWIQVSGPTVMLGYANPELVPGQGLVGRQTFRTKDLGRIDRDGRLRVVGRGDDVLISGGLNIHPAQVEDLLAGCPGIREVAVAGRPDPVWGAVLVAVYCGQSDEASVQAWCRDNLPGPLRPREFRRVSALPHTRLGKIRRRDLKRLL